MWVLGTQGGSSARAASALHPLNHLQPHRHIRSFELGSWLDCLSWLWSLVATPYPSKYGIRSNCSSLLRKKIIIKKPQKSELLCSHAQECGWMRRPAAPALVWQPRQGLFSRRHRMRTYQIPAFPHLKQVIAPTEDTGEAYKSLLKHIM